jgi:sarcosine oxidase, subunit beta
VLTTSEPVATGLVVLAAGVWSIGLGQAIGLDLPLRMHAPQMLLTSPAPRLLAPTVTAVGRPLSLKQLPSGEFFIGGGWPSDILDDRQRLACRVRADSIAGSWAVATAVVPAVSSQELARSWCGLEAECFDGVPLIGPVPGYPGLYLAVGFSGHGFQIAPAVGRAVADGILGLATPALDALDPVRAARFDPGRLAVFKSESSASTGGQPTLPG